MLHRVGHFTAKNVPGGWGISSHDNVENPCPQYFPRLGGVGVTIDCCNRRINKKCRFAIGTAIR